MNNGSLGIGDLLYNLQKIKEYYSLDLGKSSTKLNNYLKDLDKRKSKNLQIEINDVENEVKKYWKELILDTVKKLLQKIDRRRTKGLEFAKIRGDLKKTQEDLPYDNLDIQTLKSYYEETLKSYKEEIKEKIEIEKYNNNRFWIGLIGGFIAGIIASIIAGILLGFLKF